MLITWRFVVNIIIAIILFSSISYLFEYPEPVLNAFKAIDWCEENVDFCVCDGGTCIACVEKYKKAHNLSDDFEFYCWTSDEIPPTRLDFLLRDLLGVSSVFFASNVLLPIFIIFFVMFLAERKLKEKNLTWWDPEAASIRKWAERESEKIVKE